MDSKEKNENKPYVSDLYDPKLKAVAFYPVSNEDAITGQTFFARDPEMHKALIEYYSAKKSLPVPEGGYHIFFPASSVGCEPFYFAMLAREKGLLNDNFLTVHASDLQQEFIKYAKRGKYPKQTIKDLEENLKQHFQPVADGGRAYDDVQLSPDIIQSVKFEAPGDVRAHAPEQPYDAVVLPHLLYHLGEQKKEQILRAVLRLSKNLVVTDYLSFNENRNLYEKLLMEEKFGGSSKNLDYKPITVTHPLTIFEKFLEAVNPWYLPRPVTDLKENIDTNSFIAVKAPNDPSLG